MTETSTQADRATCPDCEKDVAVNRDGTLRKHTCEPAGPAESVQEPTAAETPPEGAAQPAAAEAVRTAGGRPLCAAARCDRVAVLGKLCGAHWATRPDLRKAA